MATVLGVDATKAGWVGVILTDAGRLSAVVGQKIDDLVERAMERARSEGSAFTALSVMGIDMPIGLPDHEESRPADICARKELKGRSRSVFSTPVREAILLEPYEVASRRNFELSGKKLTRQAYGMCKKLRQVDGWVRTAPLRVAEVHPELSFTRLSGEPMVHNKKTWAGAHERRRCLAGKGIVLPDDLDDVGDASVDDVLDAVAAAWTARRVSMNVADRYPEESTPFKDGLESTIWA